MNARGIKCAKCSSFQNPVYHADVAAVKACNLGQPQRVLDDVVDGGHGYVNPPSPSSQGTDVPSANPLIPMKTDVITFPEGRYAVMMPPDSKLHFFKVQKPAEGKWAGFVFVKEQASDEYYPVRGQRRTDVLVQIQKDPETAMLMYGQEIGNCGHCGRTLTNEESRRVGIGPICRAKVAF